MTEEQLKQLAFYNGAYWIFKKLWDMGLIDSGKGKFEGFWKLLEPGTKHEAKQWSEIPKDWLEKGAPVYGRI